jgi:hypothetical protein
MQKAEGGLGIGVHGVPVTAGFFEQAEGADHVGLDELAGAVDGAVDMAFGCEVQDGPGLVRGQRLAHGIAVADVGVDQDGPAAFQVLGDGGRVAGIGELVEDHDGLVGQAQPSCALEPVVNEVTADEAGCACDEDHGVYSEVKLFEDSIRPPQATA